MKPNPCHFLAAVCLGGLPVIAWAGQAELDFNDMFLGKTRTLNDSTSPNNGNLNTGSGFSAAGSGRANANAGEYDNNTGVILFEADDIAVPAGVANFVSSQAPDINGGTGVVLSSSNKPPDTTSFRRMQERELAAPLTGSEIWFSFLFRLEGPESEGAVIFNHPYTGNSADSGGAFEIHLGEGATPGAIALVTDTSPTSLGGLIGTGAIFYEDLDGDGFLDVDEDTNMNGELDAGEDVDNDGRLDTAEDADGNGMLNGVDINDRAPHLVIGRIMVDASGADDQIDVWLDPADALNLGAPTLTVLSDEIDSATGIFSIALEGVRQLPAGGDDGNGNYTFGGKAEIDHVRISDNADAQDYVTGNALPDPSLDVASDTPSATFLFGATYGTTLPVVAAPLTVKLINNGMSEDIMINSIDFLNGNADGVFNITAAPTTPLTLGPGESTTITMVASSDSISGQTFTDTLVIDTDEDSVDNPQDRSIPVSAQFFPAGFLVNTNGSFDANTNGWITDDFNAPNSPPVRRTPGFNGTAGNVRMKGVGDISPGDPDPQNPLGDNFSQTVPLGASDWEFTFIFSPLDAGVFENYSGGSSPFSGDRTFQVVIQGDNDPPVAASGTEGAWTDSSNGEGAMINLTYQPAGDDFYVFDGNGGGWTSLGIGGLLGSIDGPTERTPTTDSDGDGLDDDWEDLNFGDGIPPAEAAELAVSDGTGDADFDGLTDLDEFRLSMNPLSDDTDQDGALDDFDIIGDGALDPANPLDQVNWYLVRVKGTGFGTAGASYTVSVSDANTLNVAQTSAPQSVFQTLDITQNTPGAYTFVSGDASATTGNGALTTSYWIDEVNFWSGQARDPVGTIAPGSLALVSHNGAAATGQLTIGNAGFDSALTVASIELAGTGFSVTDPAVPFDVPAGGSQVVTIAYSGAGLSTGTATITTNDPLVPVTVIPLSGAATSDDNLLANFDFETLGDDPEGDSDTFAVWQESGNGTSFVDFGGLIPGSNTSLRAVADGQRIGNSLGVAASDFQIDFPFVLFQGGGSRYFNMHLTTSAAPNGGQDVVNWRINTSHVFQAYDGGAWAPIPNLDFSTANLTFSEDSDDNGSLDDAGDTKKLYWMRIVGTGWGTPDPTIAFELFDSDGVSSLGASGPQGTNNMRYFSTAQAEPLRSLRFLTDQAAPRYAIDDVVVKLLPPPVSARLADVSLNETRTMGTLFFTGLEVGQTYHVIASDDGQNFIPVPGSQFTAAAAEETLMLPVDIIANPLVIVKGEVGVIP